MIDLNLKPAVVKNYFSHIRSTPEIHNDDDFRPQSLHAGIIFYFYLGEKAGNGLLSWSSGV